MITDIASLGIEVESREVDTAEKRLDKLTAAAGGAERSTGRLTKATDRLNGAIRVAGARFQSIGRQIFSLKGLIAGLGTGILAKSFLDAARETENYSVRLQTLLGSLQAGNELFAQLSDLAGRVPFEYRNIMEAGTTLSTVIRTNVEDITKWTEITADLAAAFGFTIEGAAQQMVRALSAGASAADTFRERGVNAFLGFQAGVAVSAEETRRRILEQWEKVDSGFRGATIRLAKTWDGTVSMLSDKWFQFRYAVANNGPFEFLKASLQVLDEEIGLSFEEIQEHGKRASDIVMDYAERILLGAASIIDFVRPFFSVVSDALGRFIEIYNSLPDWAKEVGLFGGILLGPKFAILAAVAIGLMEKGWAKVRDMANNDENVAPWFRDFMNDPLGSLGVNPEEIPKGSWFPDNVTDENSLRTQVEGVLERIRAKIAENRAAAKVAADATTGAGIPSNGSGSPAQTRINELDRERDELDRLVAARKISEQAYLAEKRAIDAENEARDEGIESTSREYKLIRDLAQGNLELEQRLTDIAEAEKKHTQAVDDINSSMSSLFPTFKNLRVEADEWRRQALENLDQTAAGYEEFAADVETIYGEMIRKAREEDLNNSKEWQDGVTRALRDYINETSDGATQWENITTNALGNMEDRFVEWRQNGEFNAKAMVDSILNDLTRLSFRKFIAGPLFDAFGFEFHSGGLVGSGGAPRGIHPGAFAGAERFHGGGVTGLGPDEVPIVAKRQEEVITRQDPRHRFNGGMSGGVSFTFYNDITVGDSGGGGGGDSKREMAEELGAHLENALDSRMAEWTRNQLRPGGMLNPQGNPMAGQY